MRKMEVILQNTTFPNLSDDTWELYYSVAGAVEVNENYLILEKGSIFSTQSYMNIFDSWAWNRYTGLDNWKLSLRACGRFYLRLYRGDVKKELLAEKRIYIDKPTTISMEFNQPIEKPLVFYEIEAIENSTIYQAEYSAEVEPEKIKPIHISVLICTYKRNKELKETLEILKNSMFFDDSKPYYGDMSIRIVDNASELPLVENEYIKLYHSPNNGGSGGFTRGIEESRKDEEKYGITHVVFMDDDSIVQPESFYRLHALLSLVVPDFQDEVIAGRMFDLNNRCVQYTASEIWNRGDIIHVGHNQDMRELKNLVGMNKGPGQYSGWWFACFPMSFVKKETPLPFFIHCDDVEYGLRHGGTPIILNGIQVWHDTYENRQSPLISYYDTRNTMIVNTIYHEYRNETEVLAGWFMYMIYTFKANKHYALYPAYLALKDYLRGWEYFIRQTGRNKVNLDRSLSGALTMLMVIKQLPYIMWRLRKAYLSYQSFRPNRR
jgi:GT2 family glycosyltransferase